MDIIEAAQKGVPWLTTLSPLPKSIVSGLLVGLISFILVLIWTPPPEEAVKEILSNCYRRAMFTRMHMQMDQKAMFDSIEECREFIQKQIPEIHRKDLQATALELLATLEQITRIGKQEFADGFADQVNIFKLSALRLFRELATKTGGNYQLPAPGTLANITYFSSQEADKPLSSTDLQEQVNPATHSGGGL